MNYVIKLINKDILIITEVEYKNLAGKSGLVFIPSTSQTINLASVSHILPEDDYWKDQRRTTDVGVLHDGTKVIRQFGQWVCADSPRTEEGYVSVHLDPSYYPEVSSDCVATPEEWDKVLKLLPSKEERLTHLMGRATPQARIGGSFKQLKDIV